MSNVAVIHAEGMGSQPPKGGGSLSWLNSNNSNTEPLSPYHKKLARVLEENVRKWATEIGIDRIGFLTLTFQENLVDKKEADRRFNSFATGVLRKCFGAWVKVCERQERGAWHFHLLIDCKEDIKTGYDFQRGKRKKSASKALRKVWSFLGEKYKSYGFGFRSELEPVKTNADGISKYMAKYLGKHLGVRRKEDAGKRLIAYSKDFPRPWRLGFTFLSIGSRLWRRKLASVASYLQIPDMEGFADRFGCKWAYMVRPIVARWTYSPCKYTPEELNVECKMIEKETDYQAVYENGNFVGWDVGGEIIKSIRQFFAILHGEVHIHLAALCGKG